GPRPRPPGPALTAFGALALAIACQGSSPAARRGALTYYESYDPRSLDPALSTDVPTGEMVTLAFDGLTRFDPDGRLLPALADRWSTEQQGRQYVFHLRPGVKFHDGTPLTALAVRASLLRVLAPGTKGGRPWPLYPIAGAEAYAAGRGRGEDVGIEVLGDSGLRFTLTEPLAIFPKFLAMPVASVVPLSARADPGEHPVGTGAWRFLSWRHDDYLLFARNPDYWGGAPAADTLTVRIIPEPLTRAAEFEAGRLSVIEVPFGETERWRRERAAQLIEKPALRVVYVALNNRRGPLADVRVRQAINRGVNVRAILATVYGGRGVVAHGAIPPSLAEVDSGRATYSYDPAAARALLAAAGHAGGMNLQLWRTAANVELSRVAQAIQAQLADIGVRVELVERDASSQREAARQGKTDMVVLDWWADYPDGDDFLYPLFHSRSFGSGGNYAFYADPVTDSLILLARRTTDDRARPALYRRIDARVYAAAPWIYLWFPTDLWARRPEVTGWDLPVIFNGQRWTGATAR
ncbi:MAG TPA: ABC transporter substrate-binding protein, partial [Gemmatimonadales bacterium]|nr:ABC transporter substrate-binding protein [Gemmatimonadales bacterium]